MEVIHAEVLDKRSTGGSSPAMEDLGVTRGLEYLLNAGLNIVEVVTDQHSSISCLSAPSRRMPRLSSPVWLISEVNNVFVTVEGSFRSM